MRILIDPQIFYRQRFGGISRYFTEVYRLLKMDQDISVKLPLLSSQNLHLAHYKLAPSRFSLLLVLRVMNKVFFNSNFFERNKQLVIYYLNKRKPDIFIPTYYDTYFLSSIGNIPFVLTVFDMIHELFPHYFNDSPIVSQKKLLIERATRIIAISENTKRDIITLYPHVDENKIDVVYLSHSIEKKINGKPCNGQDKNYLLFVGNRKFYKNFIFFITAVSGWLKTNDMRLLCLGGGVFSEEEKLLLDSLDISYLVKQVPFKDSELALYYQRAFAFVFPSKYEGFGIPVLEAMACGCPVILPRSSSFPEIAGDAGIYFELDDASSLNSVLGRLLTDESFRQEKINMGFKQEKKFSWSKTKEQCLKVYENALQ